jgi:hypothetical protein
MPVKFTESLVDSGIAILLDSIDKKQAYFDDAVKYLAVFFLEGMFMRDWIRNKMEGLQTETNIKDISASAASKIVAFYAYDWLMGEKIDFGIIKKSVMVSVGTGVTKYFFNI